MSHINSSEEPLKLVATFLGFNGVGKTTLLYNILDQQVPDIVPKVLPWNEESGPPYLQTHTADGREVQLQLRDTYVEDEYDRLRPLNFPGTDVFVICFPAVDRDHHDIFEDTLDLFWRDEIVRCGFQEVPLIMVKTKVDEVTTENTKDQVWQEAVDMSKYRVGWKFSLEVSVQDRSTVQELISRIIIAGLDNSDRKTRKCKCLSCCLIL